MSRVVTPDSTTLTLDNGDMLTVRTRLNYGEWSDALVWASLPPTADGKMLVDPAKANLYLVIAYLLDWTLTDGDGARLPLRDQSKDAIAATLRHLDPDDVHEIKAAVDAHIARVQAEKKGREWRRRVSSDFALCRVMGWTLDELRALDPDEHAVLVEDLNKQAR